jgi:hypothetical protein
MNVYTVAGHSVKQVDVTERQGGRQCVGCLHHVEVEHRVDKATRHMWGVVPCGHLEGEIDPGGRGPDVGVCDTIRTVVDADVVCPLVGDDVNRQGVLVGVRPDWLHRFSSSAALHILFSTPTKRNGSR